MSNVREADVCRHGSAVADEESAMSGVSRRGFLKLASIFSLASAGAMAVGTGNAAQAATRKVTVGSVSAHPVGKTKLYTRIPNSGLPGGYGLLITRTGSNTWRVFSNVCTHEGSPVTFIDRNTAICTNHGFKFDAKTGACTNQYSPPLRKYAATAVKGKIVVSM